MELPIAVLAGVEKLLNAYLKLDSETFQRSQALHDKIILLHINGLDIDVFSLVGTEDIQLLGEYVGSTDATISGSLASLVRLSRSDDNAAAMLESDVEISGDMRVAEGFSRMLSEASIDWEELLSKLVGDVAAYQAGSAARKSNEWVSETVEAMKSNTAEYLSEESRMVPAKAEVDQFIEEVDTLRMAGDRFEARLKLLELNQARELPTQ